LFFGKFNYDRNSLFLSVLFLIRILSIFETETLRQGGLAEENLYPPIRQSAMAFFENHNIGWH